MGDELPSEYDVIVLGTGMTECIVAAALARIGQSVLHLDRNDYYSGDWASFHFEGLRQWITKQQTDEPPMKASDITKMTDCLEEGECSLPLNIASDSISNVTERVFVCEELQNVEENQEVIEQLQELQTNDRTNTSPCETEQENLEASTGHQSPGVATEHTTSSAEITCVADDGNWEVDQKVASVAPQNEGVATCVDSNPSGDGDKEVEPEHRWTFSEIKRQWRKFSIDLMPKLLYCRGSMVELLIESDIAKYCEFRSVSRVLTHTDGALQQVPCSRADVFSSKNVTMLEKRMMMKFLLFCLDFDKHPQEFVDYEERPFTDFLQAKKLTANIRHYIQHAIAMVTDETPTIEALRSMQRFLRSLGRYGNTAFLWPLYGSGELPQCFCRMCAVFGGVYCLRRTGQVIITDNNNRCTGIIDTEGQRLTCKNLIMEASYASQELFKVPSDDRKQISRAVLLTDRSVMADTREHVSLLRLPATEGRPHPISMLELAPSAMASPDGIFVVHLTCSSSAATAEDDLCGILDLLFHKDSTEDLSSDSSVDGRPRVLWALYFNVTVTVSGDVSENIFIVGGPTMDLDFDHSIAEAKRIFTLICSEDEEFLPKAPNPEDIIYDDDNDQKEGGLDEEAGGTLEGGALQGGVPEGTASEGGASEGSASSEGMVTEGGVSKGSEGGDGNKADEAAVDR